MMTQGVIIFLLGGEPPDGLKAGTRYQGLSLPTGPMEVVVSQPGVLELDDAWHFLLRLGCESIHLLVTTPEHDHLRLICPSVRLTGVARVAEDPSGACLHGRVLH
ncbi:MAG: hypothetical protein ACLPYB_09430 [Desulfobaccales bacterium]